MNTIILDLQIAIDDNTIPSKKQFMSWLNVILPKFVTNAELTIRIVHEEEIQQLNHNYRHKNKPTNVLTFPFDSPITLDIPLLGDIILCKAVIEHEARVQHKELTAHWAHMVVHGCLHLLGYDHILDDEATEMETIEISILNELGFPNPYLGIE